MKKAKVSPDGWMQMAFQLAYYRQHGKSVPTYEAASTRKFLTGRTETVRTLSVDSVAFTKAWEDENVKVNVNNKYFQGGSYQSSKIKMLIYMFNRWKINWL